MNRKIPRRATKGEHAYIQDLQRRSPFDLVDRGRGRILLEDEYPEPLKRFLNRERTMIHVKLPAAVKRKLEARSRQTGRPVNELARSWIEEGIKRDTA